MSDINKVWLSGVAITKPVLTKLASQVPSSSFRLQVTENYVNKRNEAMSRHNIVTIESLGKSAEKIAQTVNQGSRYTTDGYLRIDVNTDGSDNIRVRSFAVYPDDSSDKLLYMEGIRQALDICRKSKNIDIAKEILEKIIKE